jgi:hypothetical protein
MSHVPHELADEFPDQREKLHAMKLTNAHFARIADSYHEVNREIHRIETGVAAAADDYLETLKKRRLSALDEIQAMLAA